MSENVGASTSRNSKGLHGLYREIFTFFAYTLSTGTLSVEVKRNGREADHCPQIWSYTFAAPYVSMAWCFIDYEQTSFDLVHYIQSLNWA
jgi:hypothetical protein